MGFTDRAVAKQAPMGHPCGTRRALDLLDKKTRADAIDAIRGPALATADPGARHHRLGPRPRRRPSS